MNVPVVLVSLFSVIWAALSVPALAQKAPDPAPASAPVNLMFDFGAASMKPGYIRVSPNEMYSEAAGFGYEHGAQVATGDHNQTTTSQKSFFFSVKVPEGNFRVKISFGDSAVATTTTIKAESGRLMMDRVNVAAGQVVERTFTVNVRTPHLPKLPLNATGREEVTLDQFDRSNMRDWDDKLTLEIISPHAALRTIQITSAPDIPTVFLAGDSTVTDRDGGPNVSWGQLLPVFFSDRVAIANHAQSGETLKSFASALRLDKVLSQMKKGDYLFIQFGHNDSKMGWPQTYVDPETTYKAYLRAYIAEARLRGATPVLITSMDRAVKETGAPAHGHGDYPKALRELAASEDVQVIDLYAMSQILYVLARSDAPKLLTDGTHSTAFGGYEFARCVATAIRKQRLKLAQYLVSDFTDFDPGHPDATATLHLDEIFSN